jgi:hypothetical protein
MTRFLNILIRFAQNSKGKISQLPYTTVHHHRKYTDIKHHSCALHILSTFLLWTNFVTMVWCCGCLLWYISNGNIYRAFCRWWVRVRIMVFNDTFKNISVLFWRSVLLDWHIYIIYIYNHSTPLTWSHCGCDRMVVGFITTYAISAYHH